MLWCLKLILCTAMYMYVCVLKLITIDLYDIHCTFDKNTAVQNSPPVKTSHSLVGKHGTNPLQLKNKVTSLNISLCLVRWWSLGETL